MNDWILFQLVIDAALFAIVIFYIVRDRTTDAEIEENDADRPAAAIEMPDTAQLEALMDELAKLIVKAEKVAVRLEKGVVSNAQPPASKPASVNPKPAAKQKPAAAPEQKIDSSNDSDEKYKEAAQLIKKGLPDEEIEKITGLPESEVSLIRHMAT